MHLVAFNGAFCTRNATARWCILPPFLWGILHPGNATRASRFGNSKSTPTRSSFVCMLRHRQRHNEKTMVTKFSYSREHFTLGSYLSQSLSSRFEVMRATAAASRHSSFSSGALQIDELFDSLVYVMIGFSKKSPSFGLCAVDLDVWQASVMFSKVEFFQIKSSIWRGASRHFQLDV